MGHSQLINPFLWLSPTYHYEFSLGGPSCIALVRNTQCHRGELLQDFTMMFLNWL